VSEKKVAFQARISEESRAALARASLATGRTQAVLAESLFHNFDEHLVSQMQPEERLVYFGGKMDFAEWLRISRRERQARKMNAPKVPSPFNQNGANGAS